jgi:hypothetical protein
MPKNNNLEPKKFPMPIKFGEGQQTEFKNHLEAVKVNLVQAPCFDEVKKYAIPFANGTWADNPMEIMETVTEEQMDLMMHHIFTYKILPTTMEAIRLNFTIEGIDITTVTHILRYRKAVFSAECSGDKWLNHKPVLVPTSIENSPEFYERFKALAEANKQLYSDMINSKQITVQDARAILPRGIETFYFMSMSLKDALMFIHDRIDKQIQPLVDNVIAYQMIIALLKQYPILVKTLSLKYLHKPAKFYVDTARQTRATNWYRPDEDSDLFEWNEKDFVYGDVKRNDINGTGVLQRDVFAEILHQTEQFIIETDKMVDETYGKGFFDQDTNVYYK